MLFGLSTVRRHLRFGVGRQDGILSSCKSVTTNVGSRPGIAPADGIASRGCKACLLPGCSCRKALDLLDEACARARIPTISRPADKMVGLVVTARTVAEVLGEWKGISADALLNEV